jgi:MFS family permease
VGFAIKDVVLLYALFNIAFVIVSAPIGKLGDYIGRKKIIALSYIIYLVMCLGFVFAYTKLHIIALFVLFGVFYAIDEGQSKAYVLDYEKKQRATAIGTYYLTVGLIYLPASLIAGFLWKINPDYSFIFAGAVSLAALVFFLSQKK